MRASNAAWRTVTCGIRSTTWRPDVPTCTRRRARSSIACSPRREVVRSHAIVDRRMTSSVPFRDTFWNVPGWAQILLYVGGAVAIAIFVYGVWQRVQLWRAGLPEPRFDRVPDR